MYFSMQAVFRPPEKIQIVVHRESIVHSLVEFEDGAVLAQLGSADGGNVTAGAGTNHYHVEFLAHISILIRVKPDGPTRGPP